MFRRFTTACWGILANARDGDVRVVPDGGERRDASEPSVVACTLLPYDPRSRLGTTLVECRGKFLTIATAPNSASSAGQLAAGIAGRLPADPVVDVLERGVRQQPEQPPPAAPSTATSNAAVPRFHIRIMMSHPFGGEHNAVE